MGSVLYKVRSSSVHTLSVTRIRFDNFYIWLLHPWLTTLSYTCTGNAYAWDAANGASHGPYGNGSDGNGSDGNAYEPTEDGPPPFLNIFT